MLACQILMTNSQLLLPLLLHFQTSVSIPHHARCPVCKSSQWNTCPQCNLPACSNFHSFPFSYICSKTFKVPESSKCQASRFWPFSVAWWGWGSLLAPQCPMSGGQPVGHLQSSQPPGFSRVYGTTVLEMLSELCTADHIIRSCSCKVSWHRRYMSIYVCSSAAAWRTSLCHQDNKEKHIRCVWTWSLCMARDCRILRCIMT